jgi:DNA primase
LHKSFIYQLERCQPWKLLVLCESFWAPPWFYEHGVQAASLMGKEMNAEQEKLLEPFPTISVAMDNDEPGREAAQRIATRLRELGHKVWKATLME